MSATNDKPDLFERSATLATRVLSKIQPQLALLKAADPEFGYKSAVAFFLSKAFKTCQAIHLLTGSGYHQDAAILARTVFELCLQVNYIAADSKLAELFIKHDPIERYYWYMKLAVDPELLKGVANREEELATLKAQFDELQPDYIKGKGWWGSDLRSLAKEVGSEASYLRAYPLYSPLVHSTSSSVKHYIREIDQQICVDASPSEHAEVEWRWVRHKIGPFSSPSIAR
jgi:Family of unknown function (DUF5677)